VGYCSYVIDKSSSMLFEITELSDGFSETSLFSKMILIKNWQLRFPNTKSKHQKLPTNEVMIKANLTSVISPPDYRWRLSSIQFTSSSIFGSQKDIEEQADAIIMYFGLNRTHCTALLWSPLRTHTFCPFSAFQIWIRPSVEPLITNCESGEKEASRGKFFEFRWPVKD